MSYTPILSKNETDT